MTHTPEPLACKRVDQVVGRLTTLLADPGRCRDAVRALHRADGLFDVLDRLLRAGALPAGWRVTEGTVPEKTLATEAFDALSEALREDGGTAAAWRALAVGRVEWERLTTCMEAGNPLPEPWEPRPRE